MIQETIIGDLRKNGFDLVSAAEPDLLQDDPSRKLMRQIFGAIAQYETTMIVLKLRGARARSCAKNGRCEGRKPFGYFEGEAEVLTRINALQSGGLGFDRIARRSSTKRAFPREPAKMARLHRESDFQSAGSRAPSERDNRHRVLLSEKPRAGWRAPFQRESLDAIKLGHL